MSTKKVAGDDGAGYRGNAKGRGNDGGRGNGLVEVELTEILLG